MKTITAKLAGSGGMTLRNIYRATYTEEEPFDTARDSALIKAGTHFYCWGHLGARPIEEQSADPRYCQSCYEFLLQEAELLHSRAEWVPKVIRGFRPLINKVQDAPQAKHIPSVKGDIILANTSTTPAKRQLIMSTPKTPKPASGKKRRGPRYKVLPVGTIKRWAKTNGMGSKAIATRLGRERGIEVSYKTIQRILAGQRQLGL